MLRNFVFATAPGSLTSGSFPASSSIETDSPNASVSVAADFAGDEFFSARSLALIVRMPFSEATGKGAEPGQSKNSTTSVVRLNKIDQIVG